MMLAIKTKLGCRCDTTLNGREVRDAHAWISNALFSYIHAVR